MQHGDPVLEEAFTVAMVLTDVLTCLQAMQQHYIRLLKQVLRYLYINRKTNKTNEKRSSELSELRFSYFYPIII